VEIAEKDIIQLTDAALGADYSTVRRIVSSLARALFDAGNLDAAQELRALLRKRGVPLQASGQLERLPVDMKSRLPLVEEQPWPSTPIFLDDATNSVVQDFIGDVRHVDDLSRKGLASRLAMLVSGPPGTGKSLLASHIASQLNRQLYVVRLDSLISSLLGDTAKNVRALFDFAPAKNSVLFLDEIDAIAKLRDDRHELGELKRVVNTVLQGVDALDDHSIIIGATNHPQLLDQAIWRRFPYKIELQHPDFHIRHAMWRSFLFSDENNEAAELLAQVSEGLTGADIATISQTARRNVVLTGRTLDLAAVAQATILTAAGTPTLPPREGLTLKSVRTPALLLADQGLNAPKIAKLLGVTRQWALKLLKEANHGRDTATNQSNASSSN